MKSIVICGGLTLDHTVLLDDTITRDAPGGNLLYSVVGAKIWEEQVIAFGTIGFDYPDKHLALLQESGIDTSFMVKSDAPCIKVWALHEEDNNRQLIYRHNSGTNKQMDPPSANLPRQLIDMCKGVHICAIPFEPQQSLIRAFEGGDRIVSLDVIDIPDVIDPTPYANMKNLQGVTAFLPSEGEVERIFPGQAYKSVSAGVCESGVQTMVIKLGHHGCMVTSQGVSKLIPIYPCRALDTTGAGDAFCGGFVAGMAQTGDPFVSAAMGNVSSSFVIQNFGGVHALNTDSKEATHRLNQILKNITIYKEN